MFPSGASWMRSGHRNFDSNGYFSKVLAAMPKPTLLQHQRRWPQHGSGPVLLTRRIGDPVFYNETLIGNDPYSIANSFNNQDRSEIQNHRINGSWTTQYDDNVVLRGEWQDESAALLPPAADRQSWRHLDDQSHAAQRIAVLATTSTKLSDSTLANER